MKKVYNKLVRDKIPEICKEKGIDTTTRIIESDSEYLKALCEKLIEEAKEVQEDPNLEELADALEVILSTGKALGHKAEDIERERVKKAKARGSFDKRIFLISTEESN